MSDSDEMAPWYHTGISRNRAEEMLVQADKNGAFIVRSSESITGAFVLSEFFNHRVHHYRILPSEEGYFIECPGTTTLTYFKSLVELVDYYGKPKRGLVCELTYAVEQDEDDDEDNRSISLESHTKYFNALSARMPLLKQNHDFERQFRDYFSKHLLIDSLNYTNNKSIPEMFYRIFENDISNINSSIELFHKRLEYAYDLFFLALGNSNTHFLSSSKLNASKDFTSIISTLKNISELMHTTEELHNKLLIQLNNQPRSEDTYKIFKNDLNINSRGNNLVDFGRENFDVQVGPKLIKAVINVNIYDDKLTIFSNNSKEEFSCLDLLKVNKCQDNILALFLIKSSGGQLRVIFPNIKLREKFCEIIQLMVKQHNCKLAKKRVSLFIGSWNMGEATPPETLESWLTSRGTGINIKGFDDKTHDIYLIGVQENDTFMRNPFSDWPSKLRNHISQLTKMEYKIIAFEHFWHIGLVAIIKADLYHNVSGIQQAKVKTGLGKINVGSIVGNKGAVGVSFLIENTSFLFVNCHLTSGHEQKRLEKRRANYRDIMKNLIFKTSFPHCDITNQFNYIFFFGDLNYRIDLEPETILEKILESDFHYLIRHDQLTNELERNNAFFGFEEAPIRFPPTYRYILGSRDCYHILKKKAVKDRINVPSYCDRILFKSYLNSPIFPTSYGCTDEIFTSDHSPVFASFVLGVHPHYKSKSHTHLSSISNYPISIKFETFEARITRSNSNENYYFQLFSHCFEGIKKSKHCTSVQELNAGSSNIIAKWTSAEFPEPIFLSIQEKQLLVQQVIFIQVKCVGGDDDTFGEAHISLNDYFGSALHFNKTLTYQSYPVGSIYGKLNIFDSSCNNDILLGDDRNNYSRLQVVISSDPEGVYTDTQDKDLAILHNVSALIRTSLLNSDSKLFSSFSIDESIESLQNTELQKFLFKYGLGKYYPLLKQAGFKDTVQLFFIDEKYLSGMGIGGDDGKKLYSLAQYIGQYFFRVK